MVRAKQLIERGINCMVSRKKPMHSEHEYNYLENCYDYRRKTSIKSSPYLNEWKPGKLWLKKRSTKSRPMNRPSKGVLPRSTPTKRRHPSQSHKLVFVSSTLTPAIPEKSILSELNSGKEFRGTLRRNRCERRRVAMGKRTRCSGE